MALFIVRHQHDADYCPATDPYRGAALLNYLSRPNVRKHGIEIQGEAIVRGEHTLYMIVESSDETRVREFMAPFAMYVRNHFQIPKADPAVWRLSVDGLVTGG